MVGICGYEMLIYHFDMEGGVHISQKLALREEVRRECILSVLNYLCECEGFLAVTLALDFNQVLLRDRK